MGSIARTVPARAGGPVGDMAQYGTGDTEYDAGEKGVINSCNPEESHLPSLIFRETACLRQRCEF